MVSVENSKLQHTLFLGKIDREKVFGDVLDRELVKHRYKKVSQFAFFQRVSPLVLVKNLKLLQSSFLGKRGLNRVRSDVLDRKLTCLGSNFFLRRY